MASIDALRKQVENAENANNAVLALVKRSPQNPHYQEALEMTGRDLRNAKAELAKAEASIAALREKVNNATATYNAIKEMVKRSPDNPHYQKALEIAGRDLRDANAKEMPKESAGSAMDRIPRMWKTCTTSGNCTGCRRHAGTRHWHPATLKGGKYCTDCRNHLNSTNIKWVNRTGSCGLKQMCACCSKSGEQLLGENVHLVATFEKHGVPICGKCLS
jgi:hypothetical protein